MSTSWWREKQDSAAGSRSNAISEIKKSSLRLAFQKPISEAVEKEFLQSFCKKRLTFPFLEGVSWACKEADGPMKINEVEAAVGVTKKNIRFYEEEGLITPSREPGNGYRSYSQTDVERLRRIKLLRKLDVPLAEIREMLEGRSTLAEGMTRQLDA